MLPFEGIDEGVVTRLDRMRQRDTCGKLDVEIQRVGRESLDRSGRNRPLTSSVPAITLTRAPPGSMTTGISLAWISR